MSSFELSFSGVINLCFKQQVKKKDFFFCDIHPFVFLRIIKIQFMLAILFLAHLDDQDGQILL